MTTRIAVLGVGKIARDQHLPAIAASANFTLAGVVSLAPVDLGAPCEETLTALKAAVPDLAAVAICTPPRGRADLIAEALGLGLDVLVEKPPAATLSEAERFAGMARAAGRSLFLAWHSREAAGVDPLAAWLEGRRPRRVAIRWREDVRVWHPGQEWIWEPGIGVFDPGINALSILTRLLPTPAEVREARLSYPADRAAPIAAELSLASGEVAIAADFSFDQRGAQTWTLAIETDDGHAELTDGGARLTIDGAAMPLAEEGEYPRLYARFAAMVGTGAIDADLSPFRLVADAFLLGRRETVGRFSWDD